ncbi:hypothetical protein [Chamaesiphon sp. GL140_3_metabinner_50]|uniref:hypothetical protein n=1 Tax=Chamaesiphon sp. GL140_3_metabinner_50 TaxID=2970812 RepID=UPI0025D96E30|nr:hypothetical protein [Chamaesiphon sp. GL140_3_metabinner_50]
MSAPSVMTELVNKRLFIWAVLAFIASSKVIRISDGERMTLLPGGGFTPKIWGGNRGLMTSIDFSI